MQSRRKKKVSPPRDAVRSLTKLYCEMRGNNKKEKKNISRMFTRFLAEYLSAEARSIFMTVERLFLSRGTLCVCVDRGERDRERERILANLPHPRIAPNLYKYRRGERVHLRAYKPPSTE